MSLNIFLKSNNQGKEQVSVAQGLASWLGFVKWFDNEGEEQFLWDYRKNLPEKWNLPDYQLGSDSNKREDVINLKSENID